MKKILVLLVVASCLMFGCKKRDQVDNNAVDSGVVETPTVAQSAEAEPVAPQASVRREDFPFEELFSVFSLFGDNIMTGKFAPQAVKSQIKGDLLDVYQSNREYNDSSCNHLEYDLFDGDCYDGFQLGCWRYDADGHVLVLIAENGGCDVNSTKYIRAYEYDPDSKNTREVDIPLNPQPKAGDFEDLIRLAGTNDIPYVREMMRDRIFNYRFSPEGLRIELNTVDDWQVADRCGFQLFYRWNGSEFVRDETVPYPCIHSDGFAQILFGEKMPPTNFDHDPMNYDIRFSEEGAIWLIDRSGKRVLEVQQNGDEVWLIEVFDPRYSLQESFYWQGRDRLAVGSRINDYFDFSNKEEAPEVLLFTDGNVAINVERQGTRITFKTTKDELDPAMLSQAKKDQVVTLENPCFKPTATVKSIVLKKAN